MTVVHSSVVNNECTSAYKGKELKPERGRASAIWITTWGIFAREKEQ